MSLRRETLFPVPQPCYLLGSFTCFNWVGERVGKGWNMEQQTISPHFISK